MQELQDSIASLRKPQVLEVLQYPDERLTQPSSPVIPGTSLSETALRDLLNDMTITMQENRAVGLAAIQVGVPLRMLVVQDRGLRPVRMVNPRIVETHGSEYRTEGCLSLRGTFVKLARPAVVTVEYFDENLDAQTLETKDLMARAILHELQHFDGKTFLDSLSDVERSQVLRKMKLRNRKSKAFLRQLTKR